MKDLRDLEKYRNRQFEEMVVGGLDEEERQDVGVFEVPVASSKRPLRVIVSSARVPFSEGWDHVSVSLPNRCPSWNEMSFVKSLFFHPDEVCFQLHPAESDHISNHEYCLHIWSNPKALISLPPNNFVGVKEMGTLKHRR